LRSHFHEDERGGAQSKAVPQGRREIEYDSTKSVAQASFTRISIMSVRMTEDNVVVAESATVADNPRRTQWFD
jgi:hypothetical protein